MKYDPTVSSSRRKARKSHFKSDSTTRRVILSAPLSKELREQYKVRSLPIHKEDEVKIVVGPKKVKGREGKVLSVYRKKFAIHVERVTRDKANAAPVQIPIHPSNVQITKLKLTEDRKKLLARKASKSAEMAQVD